MVILTNPKQKPYNPSRTFLHFKLIHLNFIFWSSSIWTSYSEVSGRRRAMRGVRAVVESMWQSEGRGARVRRSIGRPELRNLDPFLMLDEFEGSRKEGAGFPDHPHRQVTRGYSYFRWWDRDPPPPILTKTINSLPPKLQRGGCIALLFSGTEPRHVYDGSLVSTVLKSTKTMLSSGGLKR